MMDNDEKIRILDDQYMLGDIRQRLGAKDDLDESKDHLILKMDARELVAKQTGWELGDESWAYNIIDKYLELKNNGIK